MSDRDDLILRCMKDPSDETEAAYLDTTLKFILSDLAAMYLKFWKINGAGVLVMQPEDRENSFFYLGLKELEAARKDVEDDNDDDLGETFRRIIKSAYELDPTEKAAFLVKDSKTMKYIEVDLNKDKE